MVDDFTNAEAAYELRMERIARTHESERSSEEQRALDDYQEGIEDD